MARLIADLLMPSRVMRRGMTWGRLDLSAAARPIGAELAGDDPGRQVKLAGTPKMVADRAGACAATAGEGGATVWLMLGPRGEGECRSSA